jgi:hypothetical protein
MNSVGLVVIFNLDLHRLLSEPASISCERLFRVEDDANSQGEKDSVFSRHVILCAAPVKSSVPFLIKGHYNLTWTPS